MSAGIACYPHADFKKSEILINCRKALLHSAFFGSGSITAFDAVSLNVSGDIYYSDGDLPSAVREYRRGLVCEPGNVNLLNSLGVSYAMMNKHSLARESFKKALAIDPENCMSLYNLGLEEVLRSNISRGLQCFEKALSAHVDDDGPEVKRDLQFQLAKLYCGLQEFDKALELLTQWYEACKSSQSGGHALRYLGEACFGLGKKSEAMVWLQKALRFNEFDHEALSLLGLVYLEEGEGKDIALALCQKSVELSPADRRTRLRLAKVQTDCNLFAEARENLVKCRGNKHIQMERQFLMGRNCLKMGKRKQANYWFTKVLQQENIPPEMLHEIHAAIEN
ncbi:MAG: tetratricopeptide repeat protein [Desulfobulbaceae bacterium]|nr:MAG: tetratricopeptide repeat protein [Desulfobulbaceae bacterium]